MPARSGPADLADLVALVALSLAPPAWRRRAGEELRSGRSPNRILQGFLEEPPTCWPVTIPDLEREASAACDRGARAGLQPVRWSDPAYPAMLAAIPDAPFVLWVQGSIPALDAPAVAIVGSRAGSPYALAVAERLAGDLAARGWAVVSGLARGVDSAAHRGALAGGGVTIAVLGSGADIVYPREHAALARDAVAAGGAIVSELAPGTPPQAFFFPMRNRIISGLSRAVVVIEAGEKSGSLITARAALEQGRDVLAVPGNVLDGRNRGGHALLRDGAKIVECADDILEELGVCRASGLNPGSTGAASKAVDPVLDALAVGEAAHLDAIAERSGVPVPRLLPRLFELEMQGSVRRAGGGRFVRI